MPTIKIWNIKGNGGKSSTNSLKDSISYIKDSKKSIEVVGGTDESLGRSIMYTSNKEKTMDGSLIKGYLCSIENALEEFETVKEDNLKRAGVEDSGNIAYHVVISWKRDEYITGEEAVEYAMEFMKRLGHHQAVIAVHTNTDNLHAHIVFNAHTMEPEIDYGSPERMKYDDNTTTYYQLQKMNDKLSLEKGYDVIKPRMFHDKSKTWYEYHIKDLTDIKGNPVSEKESLKSKLDSFMIVSQTKEEYFENCKKADIDVRFRGENGNISYKHKESGNPTRASTLGYKYTSKGLDERFQEPEKNKIIEITPEMEREVEAIKTKINKSKEIADVSNNLNPVNDYVFRVSKYHDGRKRGLIETALLIGINSLRKQKHAVQSNKIVSNVSKPRYLNPMEKKIAESLKALTIVTDMNIIDQADLNNRLKIVGKDLYKIKTELNKSNNRINALEDAYKMAIKIKEGYEPSKEEMRAIYKVGFKPNEPDVFIEKFEGIKNNHDILLKSQIELKKDYSQYRRVERQYNNSISEEYVTSHFKDFDKELEMEVKKDMKTSIEKDGKHQTIDGNHINAKKGR